MIKILDLFDTKLVNQINKNLIKNKLAVVENRKFFYFAYSPIKKEYIFKDKNISNYYAIFKNKKLIGILSLNKNYHYSSVSNIGLASFEKTTSYSFKKEVYSFLNNLFKSKTFKYYFWDTAIGNKIEKTMDHFIKKYNSITKIIQNISLMYDGKWHDTKFYFVNKM